MSPNEKQGRRVLGAFAIGIFIALIDFGLDFSFSHSGAGRATLITTILNDLIIGAAAGLFGYFWMARQAVTNEREFETHKLVAETLRKERKRIALDLHDTVSQAQAAAILQLECASDSLNEHSRAAPEHVSRALKLIRMSMTEMRCSLWDLYPDEVRKGHLKKALEGMIEDLTAGNGLSARLSLGGTIRRLPPEIERGLLRISQEALSNVVRHAQAHEVHVELILDSQHVRLCVRDDGLGFQPQRIPGTFGLNSMQDRTRALGGEWTIHSEPGHGTEVLASIPIPPAAQ